MIAIRLLLTTALLAGALGCAGSQASLPRPAPASGPYEAYRGPFAAELILTGELRAVRSEEIIVPRTPTWNVQIRSLAEDGARVVEGQTILELDNSAVASQLEQRELAMIRAEIELDRKTAEVAGQRSQRAFDLEKARLEREKARIEAAVPKELRPRREYQEKELELERAESAWQRAARELESFDDSSKAEIDVLRVAWRRAAREVQAAERALEATTVVAPRSGIFVVETDRREGRKLQVGDGAHPGLVVGRIPDLTEMQIDAQLSDVDDGRIVVGAPVECRLDAWPERLFTGRITSIAPTATEVTFRSLRRAFRVRIALDESDPEIMRPGMSVAARVLVESPGEEPLLAPRGALAVDGPSARARLAGGGWTEVTLGPCNARVCVVTEGLEEGQRLAPAADPAASAASGEPIRWTTVERGDLVLGVDVEGSLRAVETSYLGPPAVEGIWDYQIAFMAPEGSEVEAGEPVLAFDTDELTKRLEEVRAEADQADQQIEKQQAELRLAVADSKLKIVEAEGRLRRSGLKTDVPEIYAKDHELRLALLDRQIAEREVAFLEAKDQSSRISAEAALDQSIRQRDWSRNRLAEIEDSIARMTVAAPRAGTVVYVSDWRGEKKKVGDSTWRDDKVVEIPDLSRMQAVGTVAESDASRIAVGERITFRLDAEPDREFAGRVVKVHDTIRRKSWRDPQKVVRIDIEIDEADPGLMRPGMRFRGTIEARRIDDALLIPDNAVRVTADGPVAYRRSAFGYETVALELGQREGRRIEVLGGLAAGDRIAVVDPYAAGEGR